MTVPSQNAPLVDAGSPDKPGDGIWMEYIKASKAEEGRLSEQAATTMNGMLAFTGLFAAVVAAFTIESYKSLSPDPTTQTNALLAKLVSAANVTFVAEVEEPFRVTTTAIVINTVWFAGLTISLACALLVTMIQECARVFKRAQVCPADGNLEQHSLVLMLKHMGVQNYGLDRIAWLTVGLMHFAVILFVVGMDIYLFSAHPIPATVTTAISGGMALSYVIASAIPLFDANCPYSTPLTQVLIVLIIVPMSTISCLLGYTFLLCDIARSRFQKGHLDPTRRFPSPRFMWNFILDPFRTADIVLRIMSVVARHVTRPTFRRTGPLRDHIAAELIKGEASRGRPAMSKKALHFLWDRVGVTYILAHPRELQYVALHLLNAERRNYDSLLAGLRRNKELMAKVSAAFASVDSVFAAKGALRLLQALLLAENPNDEHAQTTLGKKWALANARAVYDVFPVFVANISRINRDALREGDVSLLAAVSSLRWVLIRALYGTQGHFDPHSIARKRLQHLLGGFNGADDSLRLLSLSSDDEDGATSLLTADCLELAYRNAFTLLAGARSCHWRGDWKSPDSPYLDTKSSPSMWSWPEVFNDAIQRSDKPPASALFCEFLINSGLRAWTLPGSKFADPEDRSIDSVAVGALRDLAKDVSFPDLPQHFGGGSDADGSATRVAYDTLRSPAMRGVEGKADTTGPEIVIALTALTPHVRR